MECALPKENAAGNGFFANLCKPTVGRSFRGWVGEGKGKILLQFD